MQVKVMDWKLKNENPLVHATFYTIKNDTLNRQSFPHLNKY